MSTHFARVNHNSFQEHLTCVCVTDNVNNMVTVTRYDTGS